MFSRTSERQTAHISPTALAVGAYALEAVSAKVRDQADKSHAALIQDARKAKLGPVELDAGDVLLAVQAILALQKDNQGSDLLDDQECREAIDESLEELREFVARSVALAAGARDQKTN